MSGQGAIFIFEDLDRSFRPVGLPGCSPLLVGRLAQLDLQPERLVLEISASLAGALHLGLGGSSPLVGHLPDSAQTLHGRLQSSGGGRIPVEGAPRCTGCFSQRSQAWLEFGALPSGTGEMRPQGILF